MAHIHTGEGHHDHTSTALIVRYGGETPKIILHIHKEVGTLLPFGGHIELNENPWQCLVREIREESGYEIGQLKIFQPKNSVKKLGKIKIHPLPFMYVTYEYKTVPHFHTDSKYLFVTSESPKHRPASGESEIIKSFSKQEIIDLPSKQIKDYDRKIYLNVFDKLLAELEPIDTTIFS